MTKQRPPSSEETGEGAGTPGATTVANGAAKYYTTAQAARKLKLHTTTILKHLKGIEGVVKTAGRGHGQVLIPEIALPTIASRVSTKGGTHQKRAKRPAKHLAARAARPAAGSLRAHLASKLAPTPATVSLDKDSRKAIDELTQAVGKAVEALEWVRKQW